MNLYYTSKHNVTDVNFMKEGIFDDAPTNDNFWEGGSTEDGIFADPLTINSYSEETSIGEDIFADADSFLEEISTKETISKKDSYTIEDIFADALQFNDSYSENPSSKEDFLDNPSLHECTSNENSPMIKRSSSKTDYENFHKRSFLRIPRIQFGVEMEMIIPQDSNNKISYESLAEELSVFGQKVEFVQGEDRHVTRQCWKLVTDMSVEERGGMGYELVSPVLIGEEGIQSMREIYQAAKQLGSFVNDTCGFHVHIDAQDMTLDQLRGIGYSFFALEDGFDRLVERSRRGNENKFCQSNNYFLCHSVTGPLSNKQLWERFQESANKHQLVNLVNASSDGKGSNRYRKINFTNIVTLGKPSTIEFRQHAGVKNMAEAEAWVRLLLLFCEKSDSKRLNAYDALGEFDYLFQLVGCRELSDFYKKFRPESPSHAWRCLCGRTFQDSKAITQHQMSKKHFFCGICQKKFSDWSSLNQHKRSSNHEHWFN